MRPNTELLTRTLQMLENVGWASHSVDDGGDEHEWVASVEEAVEAVEAVDVATLRLRHTNTHQIADVVIVPHYNIKEEIFCDMGGPEEFMREFDATIDALRQSHPHLTGD